MTTHRFHPAYTDTFIKALIASGEVPENFAGDDPDAVLFDYCKRCEEHTKRPDLSLDNDKKERLVERGQAVAAGTDFWRSMREQEAEGALYRFKPRPRS